MQACDFPKTFERPSAALGARLYITEHEWIASFVLYRASLSDHAHQDTFKEVLLELGAGVLIWSKP